MSENDKVLKAMAILLWPGAMSTGTSEERADLMLAVARIVAGATDHRFAAEIRVAASLLGVEAEVATGETQAEEAIAALPPPEALSREMLDASVRRLRKMAFRAQWRRRLPLIVLLAALAAVGGVLWWMGLLP